MYWKLLSDKEKKQGYYFKHIVEGLLRGNIKTRYEAYAQMWDRGVFSINDILKKEDLNPIDGGDTHWIPMNFIALENAGEPVKAMANDIAQRLASREIKELTKHAKHADKSLEQFGCWLQDFYKKHDKYIGEAIQPLVDSFIKPVHIELLSLQPFMLISKTPQKVLADRSEGHAEYIASNLRGLL